MQQRVLYKTLLDVPGIDGCSCNACPHMRLNTLEKLRDCLDTLQPAIGWRSPCAFGPWHRSSGCWR